MLQLGARASLQAVNPRHELSARERPRFSVAEERAHYLSHALGAALSIPAVALLIRLAAPRGVGTFIGCSIYGVTLVLMYVASTAYHAVPFGHLRAKQLLRTLDHGAIFLLICGTYTPLALTVLHDATGYLLLAAVWLLCGLGLSLIARREPKRGGPILLYLAMAGRSHPRCPR
jgi:hemolysin III